MIPISGLISFVDLNLKEHRQQQQQTTNLRDPRADSGIEILFLEPECHSLFFNTSHYIIFVDDKKLFVV